MSSEIFTSQWNKLSIAERRNAINQYTGCNDIQIVYLDDEFDIIEVVSDKITQFGFIPYGTSDFNSALDYIKKHRSTIALIISDFKMPTMDGFEFRHKVLQIAPEIPFSILSGYVDRETALKGLEFKITSFLDKPINDNLLNQLLTKDIMSRLSIIKEERDLLKGFTDDASNLIELVEELILELEENPSDHETVSKIFGMIHTIKGSSGFFEPRNLHSFAHKFEDNLKEIQSGSQSLTPNRISTWLKACDTLKHLINEFKVGEHADFDLNKAITVFENISTKSDSISDQTTDVHAPLIPKTKGPQELKVSVTLLDEFMQISGEMTVIRNMINKIVRSIEKQYPSDRDVALLSELLGELHKVNSSVQSKITEIRKVPVRAVVKPLVRIIRDTSQALKKEVDLQLHGEEIRIDTSVAEVLSSSLIHLIRNSLDHGIESPEERLKKGKPRKGEVKIKTRIQEETILIDIEDDGKGINPEAIKNKLVSNGSHTRDQVEKMSEVDLFHMIFSAGFSTAQQITDLSGRGVGMSMVKDVVEAIGGKIIIHSLINKGTKFTLNIPIPKSVLITNCLFVISQNMQFGVPQDQIKRILKIDEAKQRGFIDMIQGAEIFRCDNELLPIVYLKNILSGEFKTFSTNEENNSGYLVILTSNNRSFCLSVDSVLDVEDTVVKTISAGQIKNIGIYTGATFLGDGTIGLILNVEGIAQRTGVTLESRRLENYQINSNQSLTSEQNNNPTNNTTDFKLEVLLCALQGQTLYAIPQENIFRLEEFNSNQIQQNGDSSVLPYRNKMLTLIDFEQFILNPKNLKLQVTSNKILPTLVVQYKSGYIGLIVHKVLDLMTALQAPDEATIKQPGCKGWLILGDKSVVLVDIHELIAMISSPEAILPPADQKTISA